MGFFSPPIYIIGICHPTAIMFWGTLRVHRLCKLVCHNQEGDSKCDYHVTATTKSISNSRTQSSRFIQEQPCFFGGDLWFYNVVLLLELTTQHCYMINRQISLYDLLVSLAWPQVYDKTVEGYHTKYYNVIWECGFFFSTPHKLLFSSVIDAFFSCQASGTVWLEPFCCNLSF